MVTLDRISPVSFARVASFFGVVAGVIAGLIIALVLLFRTGNAGYALLGFFLGVAGVTIAAAILGALDAVFYNFAAELVGGLRGTFAGASKKGKANVLKDMDVVQYGKVESVKTMIVVAVIGAIFWIVNAAVHILPVGDALALGILVVVVLLSGVVGFVGGALTGVFYNFGAEKFGGIKFELANSKGFYNKALSYIDYMSFAKVYVVIIALWGIIQLAIRLVVGTAVQMSVPLYAMHGYWTLGPVGAIFGFIVSVIFGFVAAIVISLLYNAAAGRIGGVELKLK